MTLRDGRNRHVGVSLRCRELSDEPTERAASSAEPATLAEVRHQMLVLLDKMEKVDQALELLEGRTNTIVRLLDLVGRRVDRLESSR